MINRHFPIGIQLFNRLDYSIALMESLSQQTIEVNPDRIHFFIDGYKNSKMHLSGSSDLTGLIADVTQDFFPGSTVHTFDSNLGIGRLHHLMQKFLFEKYPQDNWCIFLEEDCLLQKDYLDFINHFASVVDPYPSIAKIGTFQLLNYRETFVIEEGKIFPGRGTKAFAEKSQWFKERLELTEMALQILTNSNFSDGKKYFKLAKLGMLMEFLQKDDLLDRIILSCNKLHVVLPNNLVRDDGIIGNQGFTEKPFDIDNSMNNLHTLTNLKPPIDNQITEVLEAKEVFVLSNLKRILKHQISIGIDPVAAFYTIQFKTIALFHLIKIYVKR